MQQLNESEIQKLVLGCKRQEAKIAQKYQFREQKNISQNLHENKSFLHSGAHVGRWKQKKSKLQNFETCCTEKCKMGGLNLKNPKILIRTGD